MRSSNKSQIFVFDMILSIVIIILSVSLIFLYYVDTIENSEIYDSNKEILNSFTTIRINSLNSEEVRILFIENKIRNIENTVAQQVAEFYYFGEDDYAQNLTRIFVKDYLDRQMNFNLTLSNATTTFVLFNLSNRPDITYENSSLSSVTKRTIFGFNNTEMFGPYLFEVRIWK